MIPAQFLKSLPQKEIGISKWHFKLIVFVAFWIGFATGTFVILKGVDSILADTATSTSYNWTFVTSDDYTLSDSNAVEISGNTARLKVNNYQSDANTKFLAHFDESSGTSVTDSSANANNGTLILPTPTPATIWAAGKLDGGGNSLGALSFDGAATYVTTSDSAGQVSLTGSNTIEAWVKFNHDFSISSHGTRQYVVDKGEYQLYFDHETGKLVYQLRPNSTETWSQKGGSETSRSWDTDGKNTVTALAKTSNYVYAGTGSGAGDAEVWQWDGTSAWTKVGGNQINGSWEDNQYEEVTAMAAYGEDLLVGMGNTDGDADLYYFDYSALTWTQIGGDSGGSSAGYSWNTGINAITAIAVSGTRILVGTGNGASEGDLWLCDLAGSGGCTKTNGWTQIGGDSGNTSAGYSWNSGFDQVWSIYLIGTKVMVGIGNTATEAELWQCDLTSGYNGCTKTTGWTKIGGDGVLGSWNTVYETVTSVTSYVDTAGDTQLLAALGLTAGTAPAGDAEIWRCNWTNTNGCTDANSWTGTALIDGNTGSGTAPQSWGNAFERIWNIAVDDQSATDYLYVGLGDSSGDAEIWRCDLASDCTNTTGWTKLGGDGNSSSWSGAYYYARSLILDGTTLYTGLYSASAGLGELWRYNGSWTRIGGQYLYGGWGYNGLDRVMSLTTRAGKLYAGTGTGTGDSTVWEYDGTNWSQIGGQTTKGSWTYNTIETVESLTAYKGDLYAGLGNTNGSDDGQVWKYNGTVWSQVGGHGSGVTGSWVDADNMEGVYSLVSDKDYLYAGTGYTADDAKVYSYNGTIWTHIAGKKTPAFATGWQDADNIESVLSLVSDGNYLYAGLGLSADDADVWMYDKTAGTWSQIANAGAASSTNGNWYNIHDIEGVYSMTVYNGNLYAGLGASTGDAKVYKYDGGNWTLVAGVGADSGYGGWGADYEMVRTMTVSNGYLYAGLGSGDAEAEVWKFDGTSWTKIGGDGIDNGTWLAGDNLNTVYGLVDFQGKLYAGTGDSSQTETTVWAYGNNLYLESDTAVGTPTSWHHYAASYDGTTARMYIDGTLQTNTDVQTLTVTDSAVNLLIGTSYGGSNSGGGRGWLDATVDELRISDTTRSSFTTTPFSTSAQYLRPAAARLTSGISSWSGFSIDESPGTGGQIRYQLSSDGGTSWKYYTSSWVTASEASIAQGNTETEISDHISSFPLTASGIVWRAILSSPDGADQVSISNALVTGIEDSTPPTDPTNFHMYVTNSSGTEITGGTSNWYNSENVFVSWDDSTDTGSGLEGYYAVLGESDAEPEQTATSSAATNRYFYGLTSDIYYLRVRAKDIAGNHTDVVPATEFVYQLDVTDPASPTSITVSPAGYSSDGNYTFTWPAAGETGGATDSGGSGIYGYQYRTDDCEAADGWSATITENTVSLSDISYQIDANNFCLRAVDTAGNVDASPKSVYYYYAGDGPSAPRFLTVDDTPKTVNSFAFSWQAPTSYSGDADDLTYCYTINTMPSANTCTYTSAGATSLAAGAFATQYGPNIFRLAARNPEDLGGAINYGTYAEVTFTAYTSSPGIPLDIDVSDISVKSTSTWRLTISWNPPTDTGSGIANYQVHRSTDASTYTLLASTTGTAYVDVGLAQSTYYYKVRACDSVSNCGEFTTVDSGLPTGKYTSAATLTSGPTASGITTKQSVIGWTTDRTCDSRVQYGTSSGSYLSSEPSNSTHTTNHSITLTNLSPGTTYYYKTKWTDEDGNTGTSSEKSFTTSPAPAVKDVGPHTIGLTGAFLHYTTSGASKVRIYYGQTTSFGGVKELSTSTAETAHVSELTNLEDGTKYYYTINTFDSDNSEYAGTILNFTTLPRPKITNVRIQQVVGTAQPTALVVWETNTDTSSIVTYYPEGQPEQARDEVNVALTTGVHKIIIRGLIPQTPYVLQVKGRDKAGNEASSTTQRFTTATDTRPPQITDLKIEGTIQTLSSGSGQDNNAQLVISWNTDELSTSQVEFGEGTGTTYAQKTQEDSSPAYNHLVVISGLSPSKVYHLRALSKDKAANEAKSIDNVTITPKTTENALNLVISNLQQAFGFLGAISQ